MEPKVSAREELGLEPGARYQASVLETGSVTATETASPARRAQHRTALGRRCLGREMIALTCQLNAKTRRLVESVCLEEIACSSRQSLLCSDSPLLSVLSTATEAMGRLHSRCKRPSLVQSVDE